MPKRIGVAWLASLFPAAALPTQTSCKALLNAGATASGTYTIDPGTGPITVYCDQTAGGGGWTYLVRGGAKTDPSLAIGWTGHSSPPVCGTLSNGSLSWAHQGSCSCAGGPSYPGTGLRWTFPAATDFTVSGTWTQTSMGAAAFVGPSVDGTLARSTVDTADCQSVSECGWSNQSYRAFFGAYPYSVNGQILWRRTGNTLEVPNGTGTTAATTIQASDKVVLSIGSGNCSADTTPMVLGDVFYREQ